MKILEGLSPKQREILTHTAEFRPIPAQQLIFQEGDPAYGLFMVAGGKVEIFKQTTDGEARLNILGPNEIFGEMGLIEKNRTAAARALEPAIILEFRANPVETFQNINDNQAAMVLLQNFIKLMAERLRKKDRPDAVRVHSRVHALPVYEFNPAESLKVIEDALPSGWFKRLTAKHRLKAGTYLCRQGDEPDGFYFLHKGEVEVLAGEDEEAASVVNSVRAPALLGEAGFFASQRRTASLRATEPIEYTVFSGSDFQKLKRKSPREAFHVLHAAAQLLVHLILRKESL